MPTGGALTIQARNARLADTPTHHPGDAVLLEISGTSSRISNQAQQQLFAALANPSMAADAPGISLNYCRRTIQLHGGPLQFADTVGQGTTLRITLPRA